MDRLTTQQINDFNNPLAFARQRSNRIGQTVLGVANNRTIRTTNIEESFRLITGAATRLETLEGNLNTMLQLAKDGTRARGNQRQLNEVYGKLRSLSAGFDQVVEAVRFNGQPVFTNNDLILDVGPGTRPLSFEASKLLTYGDKSLNLSQAEAGADISVRYRTEDLIVNSSFDLVGLDIESATLSSGSNPALELEDGDYKLNISYAGAQSSVEIRTREGALIERKDEVDLSGSGRTWVDFNSGIRMTFNKEQILQSVDKYDFENLGPAQLSATMSYKRVDYHVLRTEEAPGPDQVEFQFNSALQVGAGKLAVADPRLSPVDTTRTPLSSGNYLLQVDYQGENSVIRLTDGLGRLKAYQFGVDLRGEKEMQIDLGVGLSFTLKAENFESNGNSLVVPISYQRARPPIEEFDFREYARRIEEAIGIVAEQLTQIDEARADIEEVNRLRNTAATAGIPTGSAFFAGGALNILNGGGNNSVFKPASPQARINTMSTQLFSITTALPSQANISQDSLNNAQMAAASGWLGTFT